jgi:hypothetical protein
LNSFGFHNVFRHLEIKRVVRLNLV